MDLIGLLIFILFVVFKFLGKLGPVAGPDGSPRPRRLPSWFPDIEESIPPVIKGSVDGRRTVPVSRVTRGGGPAAEAPLEHQAPWVQPAQEQAQAQEQGLDLQPAFLQEPIPDDIIKGLIWAEILSPPRAKRRTV